MFFPKLRRKAKWVFVLLAAAFALGFVFFGVGTGITGANPIDAIQGLFQERRVEGGPSVEEAREKAEKNPNDAKAQLELANALQSEGRTAEAIAALERYTRMRPKDESALRQLGALYDTQARQAQDRANQTQLETQEALFPQTLVQPDTRLGQALSNDPVSETLTQTASARVTTAFQEIQEAYRKEAEVYRKLSRLSPDDPAVFLQLGQASQFAGDVDAALDAYKRFLALAPDDPNAPLVREEVKRLQRERGNG